MKKPRSYRFLRIANLLMLIFTPFIFFGSLFLFDDPNANQTTQYVAFYTMNGYPFYLIANVWLSNKLYPNYPKIAYGMLLLSVSALVLLFTLTLFRNAIFF